jgi:hypothetical protein
VTESSFLFRRRRLLEKYIKGVLMVEALQDAVPLLVFLGGARGKPKPGLDML